MPYAQTVFINLPVSDLSGSITFYTSLGFIQNQAFSNSSSAMISLPIPTHFTNPHESPIKIMLLCHDFYNTFLPSNKSMANAKTTAQMILCISQESREAVDDMVNKARESGANVDICKKNEAQIKAGQESGMYGRNFEDLDGHILEVVYMPVQCYEGKE